MMFVAHDSDRYGHLAVDGCAMSPDFISRRCGCSMEQYSTLLAELVAAGVPSVCNDGVMFSRRMVRDAELRKTRAKAGQKGGKNKAKTHKKTSKNIVKNSENTTSSKSLAKVYQNTDIDNDINSDVFLMNFNKFWELMPKKSRKNKPRARESFSKALASTQLETILSAAEAYGKSDEGNGTYCRNASTWLNAEAWSDDQESWRDRHKPRNTTPEEDAEWTP